MSTLLDIVDVQSQMLGTKNLLTQWIGQKGKCVSKAQGHDVLTEHS